MNSDPRWLLIRQLDQHFGQLRLARESLSPPRGGWIRTIRRAVGMAVSQLATRMNVTPGRITQLEQQEVAGRATLSSLKKAADALDCDLVVALIPRGNLDQRVRKAANDRSASAVMQVAHSMSLEGQRTSNDSIEIQKGEMTDDLLRGPWSRLWSKT